MLVNNLLRKENFGLDYISLIRETMDYWFGSWVWKLQVVFFFPFL